MCLTSNNGVLVSVIVPVFNSEEYLKPCLDSLINQTFPRFEIICVDDRSTDNSSAILENYAKEDARVIVLRQETNKGPGPARNTALKHARGKYILFCDADDSLEPCAISECFTVMEKTSCDLLVFNANIIEDARSVPGLKNTSGEYIKLVNPENEGAMDKKETIKIMLIATVWGKMFRADLIRRYNIRFSRHLVGEDARFLLSYLLVINRGYALDKSFYNYYLRPKVLFHASHPWLGRLFRFPGIFFDVFKFALRRGIPLRIYYFFYWLYIFFKSRRNK